MHRPVACFVIFSPGEFGRGLRDPGRAVLIAAAALVLSVPPNFPLHGQESSGPTGWEPTGLPALNYDSDEGFGYGVLFELYNYGDGGYSPYRFTLQPTVFLTTGGRRQFTIFFDAPQGRDHDAPRSGDPKRRHAWLDSRDDPGGLVESPPGRPRVGYARSGDGPAPWKLVGGTRPGRGGRSAVLRS